MTDRERGYGAPGGAGEAETEHDEAGPGEVTRLLARWKAGSSEALEKVFPLVYRTLRSMAGAMLRRERVDHTLQPTALVHEAYLRMVRSGAVDVERRPEFLGLASIAMRRILIEHARGHLAEKRIGPRKASLEDVVEPPWQPDEQLLELDLALSRLAELNERQARIVEMRFFGGLANAEIAEALGTSVTTVKREWRMARAWLRVQMGRGGTGGTT